MKTALIIACAAMLTLGGSNMARGTPDGGYDPYAAASNVTDLGALANYLWGFSPIDGRGRIMFLDTFNNGLGGWSPTSGGAGSADPALVTTFVFSPPNSVNLQCGTTGPVGNGFSQIDRSFHIGSQSRIGMEAGVFMGSTAPLNQPFPGAFDLTLAEFTPDGSTEILSVVRIERASGAVKVWSDTRFGLGNQWFTVYTLPTSLIDGSELNYLQIKVAVDFAEAQRIGTGGYMRLVIGQQTINLDAYPMARLAIVGSPGIFDAILTAWADGTATHNIGRVGYVMLTGDEP